MLFCKAVDLLRYSAGFREAVTVTKITIKLQFPPTILVSSGLKQQFFSFIHVRRKMIKQSKERRLKTLSIFL